MKVYELRQVQTLDLSLEDAWDFFVRPQNLNEITPKDLQFKVTSKNLPAEVYTGLIITYIIKAVAGIPMTWVTEIKSVEHQKRFVDEQRVGPYALWHHQHHFKALPNGKTEMTDIVHYGLPLGILGRFAHAVFVKKQLQDIFNFRREKLEEVFNGK